MLQLMMPTLISGPVCTEAWESNYGGECRRLEIERSCYLLRIFPKNIYASAKIIQQATLTVSGRNLIMLDQNKCLTDPEFSEDTGNGVEGHLRARLLLQEYSVQPCHNILINEFFKN
jgi:hypothetical protein